MSPTGLTALKILAGFSCLLLGSALFSHSAERLVHRLFRNRQAGSRILGNLSLSLPEAILPHTTSNPSALSFFLSRKKSASASGDSVARAERTMDRKKGREE